MEKQNPDIVEGMGDSHMHPGIISGIFQVKRHILVGPSQTVQVSYRIPILIPTHRALGL
jgi:hypothetical protein